MVLCGTQLQDRVVGLHPAAPARQVGSQMPTGRTWDPLSLHQGSRGWSRQVHHFWVMENSSRRLFSQQDITQSHSERANLSPGKQHPQRYASDVEPCTNAPPGICRGVTVGRVRARILALAGQHRLAPVCSGVGRQVRKKRPFSS